MREDLRVCHEPLSRALIGRLRVPTSYCVDWWTFELPCKFSNVIAWFILSCCAGVLHLNVLQEGCHEVLPPCWYTRRVTCEMMYVARQNDFALTVGGVRNVEPTVYDRLARFESSGSRPRQSCDEVTGRICSDNHQILGLGFASFVVSVEMLVPLDVSRLHAEMPFLLDSVAIGRCGKGALALTS
jgi:hypothetical protein